MVNKKTTHKRLHNNIYDKRLAKKKVEKDN